MAHETIHVQPDDETAAWIEDAVRRTGFDKGAIALDLMRKGIAWERRNSPLKTYDDLDFLAGTWSEEDAAEFAAAVLPFEQVDEKLWK